MIDYGYGVGLIAEIPPQAVEWRNTYSIRKWCRQVGLISFKDQEKWLEKVLNNPTIKMFGVMKNSSQLDGHLGVAGLTSINHINQTAEFSLYIEPGSQKHGYGKMALKTLVDFGFKELNLNCIWGETFEGNEAMGMFESLGFKREGCLRSRYFKNGRIIDAYMVSVLRSEWLI